MTNEAIAARLLEELRMFAERSVDEVQASIEAHALALEGLGPSWVAKVREVQAELEHVSHAVPEPTRRETAQSIVEQFKHALIQLVPGSSDQRDAV